MNSLGRLAGGKRYVVYTSEDPSTPDARNQHAGESRGATWEAVLASTRVPDSGGLGPQGAWTRRSHHPWPAQQRNPAVAKDQKKGAEKSYAGDLKLGSANGIRSYGEYLVTSSWVDARLGLHCIKNVPARSSRACMHSSTKNQGVGRPARRPMRKDSGGAEGAGGGAHLRQTSQLPNSGIIPHGAAVCLLLCVQSQNAPESMLGASHAAPWR